MMKEPVLLLVSVSVTLELVLSETDVVGDEVVRRQPVTAWILRSINFATSRLYSIPGRES